MLKKKQKTNTIIIRYLFAYIVRGHVSLIIRLAMFSALITVPRDPALGFRLFKIPIIMALKTAHYSTLELVFAQISVRATTVVLYAYDAYSSVYNTYLYRTILRFGFVIIILYAKWTRPILTGNRLVDDETRDPGQNGKTFFYFSVRRLFGL